MSKQPEKPDDVIDAEFEQIAEPVVAKSTPRNRPAWPLVWALFCVAIVGGGALGAIAGRFLSPPTQVDAAQITALAQQLDDTKAELEALANTQLTERAMVQQQIDALTQQDDTRTTDNLIVELEVLAQRLRQMEQRPISVLSENGQPAIDLAPITERLIALETALAKGPEITEPDLSDIQQQITGLNDRLLSFGTAPLATADTRNLLARIEKLETNTKSDGVSAEQTNALADLKLAAQQPAPFAVAFASAKLAFGTDPTLDRLRAIAGTGAPNQAQLSANLTKIIPKLLREANQPAPGASFAIKAGAMMRSLVSVRRTDGKGGGLQGLLAQTETALSAGELDEAIRLVEQLNPASPSSEAWLRTAKDRQTIEQVLAELQGQQTKGDTQ